MDNILEIILSAKDQASETIRAFGDELNNVIEIAAGFSLANIAEEFVNVGKNAVDAAINFQAVTTSLGTVLANVSDGGSAAADSFGGSSGKMSDIASRTADEMRNYAEKVKKLNEEITTTLAGENVIKEQEKLNQQLEDLAFSHAEKIQSINDSIANAGTDEKDRELQRQQTMQDTLDNMTTSHNETLASKKEKYTLDMANAANGIYKEKLTKKFTEETQLENDAFNRKYTDEQAKLQKKMDEENARDKAQTQKKIDSLQDQLDKENVLYDRQKAKDEKTAAEQLETLKEDNTKKVALYKQQLDDEELLHKEHLARLTEEADRAGSGAASHISKALEANSPFRAIRRSLQDELKFITTIEPTMPFNFEDIVGLDRHMTQFGINFQTTSHMLGDAASAANVSLGTVGQAVTDATKAGRWQMLEQDLGITKEELGRFGAEFDKSGHLVSESSFWTALQKMDKEGGPIFNAMTNQMGTMKGQMTNLHTTFFNLGMDILGIDTASGKVQKGGLFDQMTHVVMDFASYLKAHKTEIADFFKNLFKGIEEVAGFLTNNFNPTMGNMVKLIGSTAGPVVSTFMKIFHDNQSQLKDIADKFKDITAHVDALWKKFDKDFGPTLKTLTETTFKLLIKQLDDMANALDTILQFTDKVWKQWDKAPDLGWMNNFTKLAGPLGGFIGHAHAMGTSFASGGLSLVGEQGPELVNLPRGSQVTPNNQINKYNSGGNVTIENVNIRNDMDIGTMVRRLTMEMKFNSAI